MSHFDTISMAMEEEISGVDTLSAAMTVLENACNCNTSKGLVSCVILHIAQAKKIKIIIVVLE